MRIDVKEAVKCLLENDNIVILTHSHPDGDTLGSAYALCRALTKKGKTAEVVCNDDIPEKYSFMFDDFENKSIDEPDYVVSVDVADSQLLGEEVKKLYEDRINLAIDHHGSNRIKSDKLLLEADSAATCEIIFLIIKELGVDLDKKIADCLYTGISTDTGCFRYYNTTSRSYHMAAELVECGAEHGMINQLMFETKTRTYMRLESLVMKSMEMYYDDKCVIVTLTQDMYEKSGSNESEIDPLAAKTRQIEGVLVGAVLREKKDGTFKVSMRTNGDMDASAICGLLGGGGHPKAAGCQIDGPLENAKQKLVEAIGEYLS